jgi:hypothetical protein
MTSKTMAIKWIKIQGLIDKILHKKLTIWKHAKSGTLCSSSVTRRVTVKGQEYYDDIDINA